MKQFLAALVCGAIGVGHAVAQQCGWESRVPAHGPQSPAQARMAFDSIRRVSVLFTLDYPSNDRETLEWNGDDWVLRATDGPQARVGTAMVFDSVRGKCLLFGGEVLLHARFDSWEWDGKAWTKAFPVDSPKARAYHAMAFDSSRGVAVLYGGFDDDFMPLGDTWEWDGVDWTQVSLSGPKASGFNSMAFDSKRGVTVLYGGAPNGDETWEWDGSEWSFRTDEGPLPSAEGALVYDSDRGVCVLYGGYTGEFGNTPSDQTWEWDGQVWTKLDTPQNPGRRADHAMAYDSARRSIVLFGGVDGADNLLDDTWEFTCAAPCYPDFDGDGELTLFDFLGFVNAFNAGEAGKADCDESGILDFFDFLCFTNAFNAGC